MILLFQWRRVHLWKTVTAVERNKDNSPDVSFSLCTTVFYRDISASGQQRAYLYIYFQLIEFIRLQSRQYVQRKITHFTPCFSSIYFINILGFYLMTRWETWSAVRVWENPSHYSTMTRFDYSNNRGTLTWILKLFLASSLWDHHGNVLKVFSLFSLYCKISNSIRAEQAANL